MAQFMFGINYLLWFRSSSISSRCLRRRSTSWNNNGTLNRNGGPCGIWIDSQQQQRYYHPSINGPTSSITEFERMVQNEKAKARRSIVLEDLTVDGYVWNQTDSVISERLFDLKVYSNIDRWRIGRRRFLLVEFATMDHLRYVTRYLHHKHKIRLYDQVCFLSENQIVRPPPPLSSNPSSRGNSTVISELGNQPEFKDFTPKQQQQFMQDRRRNVRKQVTGNCSARSHVDSIRQLLLFQDQQKQKSSNENEDILESFISNLSLQFRLRFFIIIQMESLIEKSWNSKLNQNRLTSKPGNSSSTNLMDQFEIVPFGSDVSGFGTNDSDIDLCFVERNYHRSLGNNKRKIRQYRSIKLLRSVSNILDNSGVNPSRSSMYLSQFSQIHRIFGAFVPIIKCRSRLLPDVNIDISIDIDVNSGFQMATYLYHCSNCDRRVRPFVTLLKCWAKHHNIIQSNPGDWFSSFQMTILGIAFLQYRQIVPTINQFNNNQSSTTKVTSKIGKHRKIENTQISIEEIYQLLGQFFQFMITYDFWQNGIDLNLGNISIEKPTEESDYSDYSRRSRRSSRNSDHTIYVQNPFIPELNICKTVSETELERFLSFAQQTVEVMSKQNFVLDDIFLGFNDRLNFGQFYH